MKTLSKLALIGLLAVPSVARAQAERPALPGEVKPAEPSQVEAEPEQDPSREFNWTSHPAPFGSDSYKKFDAEGGPLGDGKEGDRPLAPGQEEEPMSVPFIFVLINFGLLLILLGKKATPIATQMAATRSDEIKTALDEAARLRNAAKEKLDEYSTKLRAAEGEIDAMVKTMRETAEADRARIIADAETQAALLKKDADERIAAEIERARHTLQREVVSAAAGVAEKLLREKTTAADQANQVNAFLADVTAAPATGRPS